MIRFRLAVATLIAFVLALAAAGTLESAQAGAGSPRHVVAQQMTPQSDTPWG
jgi:hypothetical protein